MGWIQSAEKQYTIYFLKYYQYYDFTLRLNDIFAGNQLIKPLDIQKYNLNIMYRHNYKHPVFNHTDNQQEEEEEFCPNCPYNHKVINLAVRSQQVLYRKETYLLGNPRKVIKSILYGYQNKYTIDYKQALIQSKTIDFQRTFMYKSFQQIVKQVKPSITNNIKSRPNNSRIYFGEDIYKIMINHQIKKKNLSTNRNKIPIKFKLNYQSLSTHSSAQLLKDSFIFKKYDFKPVQLSVLEKSQASIMRLKRSLSIMVEEIKTNSQVYPQIKDIYKPYTKFFKSHKELKFRQNLEGQVSSIIQCPTHQNNKPITQRLYTSPDPLNEEDDSKFKDVYGLLFKNPSTNKHKKRKSQLKLQPSREKSVNNISRKMISSKSSRQVTQRGGPIVVIKSPNANKNGILKINKSKSKLKMTSKNTLQMVRSNSKTKIRPKPSDKSLSKSKRLLKTKFN